MFEGEVLQGPSQFILLCQQQDIVIELQSIEYTEIDTDSNSRRTFLYPGNGHR